MLFDQVLTSEPVNKYQQQNYAVTYAVLNYSKKPVACIVSFAETSRKQLVLNKIKWPKMHHKPSS